eukprot:3047755-Amphidinium_carterae.1
MGSWSSRTCTSLTYGYYDSLHSKCHQWQSFFALALAFAKETIYGEQPGAERATAPTVRKEPKVAHEVRDGTTWKWQ